MNATADVLFEEVSGKGGSLGIITLNRPQALNSLNHAMIKAMHAELHKWAHANHIKAVIIRAAQGRAFCAGGDLRLIYDLKKDRETTALNFFRDEYQLNRFIYHYPKPYIALLDGITMGGGVGVSIHGSHRIATDSLMFAMPETGIGFFPDIGGTYFLPRLRGRFGFYLGLTGAKLTSSDSVALGIAQYKIQRDSISQLIDVLAMTELSETKPHDTVSKVINEFKTVNHPSSLLEQQTVIEKCFSLETMENILHALEQHADNEICVQAIKAIKIKSPTSLKIALRALQYGNHLDFDACMQQEFRLTHHFLQGHDFIEGIRAVIIDKDQAPIWQPKTLEQVRNDEIDKYFSPLELELF